MNVKDFTPQELDMMGLVGTLKAKSDGGARMIKEFGNHGKVMRVLETTPFSDKKGYFFAVAAASDSYRWVDFDNDPDFYIDIAPWANDPEMLVPRTHASTKDD